MYIVHYIIIGTPGLKSIWREKGSVKRMVARNVALVGNASDSSDWIGFKVTFHFLSPILLGKRIKKSKVVRRNA